MYVPHQIARAVIDTAAEKVWTQVDHSLIAKRGCYLSAQLMTIQRWLTVLVMYLEIKVMARQASNVAVTTCRSLSSKTIGSG